ncbi:MAG: AraC family transcriptional regulator [Desulfobacterium sp.]|nr:AraC family transcriptional regulator [Desulfobacterium sp.]
MLSQGFFPGIAIGVKALDRVCSLGSWDFSRDQLWGVDDHVGHRLQLTYVARGKVDFYLDGNGFELRPGDLVITRPWQSQKVGSPHINACQLYWFALDVNSLTPASNAWQWPDWLVFSRHDLDQMTRFLCTDTRAVWQAGLEIDTCFKKMHKDLHIRGIAPRETHLKLHINELFVRCYDIQHRDLPSARASRSTAQQAVDLFLADLGNHLSVDWGLDLMAEQCGLKKSQFTQYCRKMTNRTPMEHLADLRIRRAETLLRTQRSKAVAEIALACGFHSAQYFATIFKKRVGMSPSQYREGH